MQKNKKTKKIHIQSDSIQRLLKELKQVEAETTRLIEKYRASEERM